MGRYDSITAAAIEMLAASNGSSFFTTERKALRDAVEAKHPGAVERAVARRKAAREDARYVGNVPLWAKRYVEKYWPRLGRLKWSGSSEYRGTRGRTWPYGTRDFHSSTINMYVRGGTDETTLRVLVLHEIAHQTGASHDAQWARKFHELLVAEGLYRAALTANYNGTLALRRAASAARSA